MLIHPTFRLATKTSRVGGHTFNNKFSQRNFVGRPSVSRKKPSGSAQQTPLESVVKIYAVTTSPNHFLPWQMKQSKEVTGSGFFIKGKKIITNAHIVANHSFVSVRKFGSPQKFLAKVEAIGHDCDLALLSVEEEIFWEGTSALPFGDIPHMQDHVNVIGYPTGGDGISVTSGVVSRIEPQKYTHGSTNLLAIQIDAPINPGNSGGPVLKDNQVIGIAFQNMIGAEGIGFIIPIPIIEHFLKDIEKHKAYTGFVHIGILCQPMDNWQIRKYFHMESDMTGVLVDYVVPCSPADGTLKKNDVLLEIEGIKIANDGSIPFRQRERTFFDYVLVQKFVGDICNLTILREGKVQNVQVSLKVFQPISPYHSHDRLPSYFIHAGLVFCKLTFPYLEEYGEDWFHSSPRKLCHKALFTDKSFETEEIVILSHVLVDEINYGYSTMANFQVLQFNGEKVKNLKHLMTLIEENKDLYSRIDLDDNGVIILDREAAFASNPRICQKHQIANLKSPDLLKTN
eukprot:TRINITY_DN8027_c0_g1_i1.p1 TRINITY_DN8027_c0_g1~~TRINITY_DN8027_c0_g1_i1.p1  ORF type:complete len:527 (-),score=136.94 TRINITY_DN8027_c0_g1_i1:13-1548(-)